MARFLDQYNGLVKQKIRSSLTLYSSSEYYGSKYSGKKNSNTMNMADFEGQTDFDCMISGPGVFNTAHALSVYLEQKIPDIILHTGIAGVFTSSGFGIGDIALADQEIYAHTGVGKNPFGNSPLPFDLIEKQPLTRQGVYIFDQELVDRYYKIFMGKYRIARGCFITVSSITDSPGRADEIFTACSPVMEAMEGAAAVHVATLYQVPILEIRAASNFVGERDREKWNFPLACQQVKNICETVIFENNPLF